MPASVPLILIHGAWMTPECWRDFRQPFEAAGYAVAAPAWPFLAGTAAEMRAAPPEGIGRLTVGAIVDHYAGMIRAMPEPPVLVGHSFGGLVVQLLLDRGLGRAGVALDPGPIAGLIPDPVSLTAALPVLMRWNGWSRPHLMSRASFAGRFANTLDPALLDAEYDRLVIPTSGRIFWQAALGLGLIVSPRRRTAPLLFTAAGHDRTVAPPLVRAAFRRQRRSAAATELIEFPALSHDLIAEPGWQEVAAAVLGWLARVGASEGPGKG